MVALLVFAFFVADAQGNKPDMRSKPAKEKHAKADLEKDTLGLSDVYVFGKSKTQQLKEGAYAVTAVDMKNVAVSVTNLSDFLSHVSGLNIRTEGGLGSDYQLSINGMGGNAIRYFVDGVPMDTKGGGVNLSNFPINTIDRVEVYKGVVPAYLGGDALGGAINIVTKKERSNFLDASVSAGSFHTYRADLNAQVSLGKSGIFVRPQFSYDYSKNNYKMYGVEVWNPDAKQYEEVTRRRFHDRYSSVQGQIDVGVEHKKWADRFFVGMGYTNTQKQLQTGSVQTLVIGCAERNTDAWNVHANYRKQNFLLPRLTTLLSVSHTWDHSVTVDTAFRRYDWNGNYKVTTRNELNGRARVLRHYKRPLTMVRANFSYAIAENHTLSLNYMLARTGNKRYDKAHELFPESEVQDLPEPTNDVVEKHIIGLSYDNTLFKGRMANSVFVKSYINHVDVEQNELAITHGRDFLGHSVKNFWGYGLGSRYAFMDELAVKLNYEHAVRLPLARELLGNGTTTYANLALRPETSHNVNLGVYGTARIGNDHVFHYEATGFLRSTKDYIHLRIYEGDGMFQYENVNDVLTNGVEAELRYNYSDWLQFVLNGSWQESLDMQKYLENGNTNATYRNRIPNRPWLFGNAELTLTHRKLFFRTDRIRFNLLYQFVHWYYLTWEAYGNLDSKARIPSQNVLNAALTYSWQHERYNVTLSCDNIANVLCYDNYKLQKPGRSFMCKFALRLH